MRTAGLMMNDVWAHRVLREQGVTTWRFEGLDADIDVLADAVDLNHHGPEQNYRPYLHVMGSLRGITIEEPLPYGLTGVDFSDVHGERIHAFYEFSDEQLAMLARKGYFTPGFQVPRQIVDIMWPLPATVDLLVLAPDQEGRTPSLEDPLQVFTRVHDAGDIRIDVASSDEVVRFFADHSLEGGQVEDLVDERGLRARADAINPLFAEDALEQEGDQVTVEDAAPEHEVDVDEVEEMMRRTREQVEEDEVAYQLEQEGIEGTPENLYRRRVALPVEAPTDDSPARGDLDLTPESAPGRHRRPVTAPPTFDPPEEDIQDHQPGG